MPAADENKIFNDRFLIEFHALTQKSLRSVSRNFKHKVYQNSLYDKVKIPTTVALFFPRKQY